MTNLTVKDRLAFLFTITVISLTKIEKTFIMNLFNKEDLEKYYPRVYFVIECGYEILPIEDMRI